jgi:F420 biosynthesis protein FbiB-like protein
MELKEAIEQRRTVRKFTGEPVAVETLKELVGRALCAPSINNSQPWKFIAVTNQRLMSEMATRVSDRVNALFANTPRESLLKTVEHFSTIFQDAPAMIFVAAQPYRAPADDLDSGAVGHEAINEMRRHPDIQSIGAAVQNILLSAVDLGLGACWLSGLMAARQELEALLDIQQPWELVTAVAVGKPESRPSPRTHRPVEDFFKLIQ